MADELIPRWIRYMDIAIGLVTIITGLFIIVSPALARYTMILVLTIALFAVGLARVSRAASVKSIGKPRQAINLISGITILIIVFILFFTPAMISHQAEMIILVAIAWIITALARIIVTLLDKEITRPLFYFQIVIGIVTIPLGIWVLLYSAGEDTLLLTLLGIVALSNGMARTSRGYAGV